MMEYNCKESGLAILHAREERCLSQRMLADEIGCGCTSIFRIEHGENINILYGLREIAEKAAKHLGVELVVRGADEIRCLTCAQLHVIELGRLESPRLKGICMHYGDGEARRGCMHYEEVLRR